MNIGWLSRLSDREKRLPAYKQREKLQEQMELGKFWAKNNNRRIVKFYNEYLVGGSKEIEDRVLKDILEDANKGLIQELGVKDSARFSRRTKVWTETLERLEKYKVKVYSVLGGYHLDHQNQAHLFLATADEGLVLINREKQQSNLKMKMIYNLPVTSPPLGYKWKFKSGKVPIGERNTWVIDEENKDLILEIFKDEANEVDYKITLERLKIDKNVYYNVLKRKRIYQGFIVFWQRYSRGMKLEKPIYNEYKGQHEPILKVQEDSINENRIQ